MMMEANTELLAEENGNFQNSSVKISEVDNSEIEFEPPSTLLGPESVVLEQPEINADTTIYASVSADTSVQHVGVHETVELEASQLLGTTEGEVDVSPAEILCSDTRCELRLRSEEVDFPCDPACCPTTQLLESESKVSRENNSPILSKQTQLACSIESSGSVAASRSNEVYVNPSHSTIVVHLPAFGVPNTESVDSIKNFDSEYEEDCACTEGEKTIPASNEKMSSYSIQGISSSLPPDDIYRQSSVLIDSEGVQKLRRRITASAKVDFVDYWSTPQMPRFVHLRHSYPNLQASSPWIYNEVAVDTLNRMPSTSSITESESLSDNSPRSETSQRQLTPARRHSSSNPTAEVLIWNGAPSGNHAENVTDYVFQPYPSVALDYVQDDNIPPEHPFPARSTRTDLVSGAVMAYVNTALPLPETFSRSRERSASMTRRSGFIQPASAPSTERQKRFRGFMRDLRSELFYNVNNSSDSDLGVSPTSSEDLSEQRGFGEESADSEGRVSLEGEGVEELSETDEDSDSSSSVDDSDSFASHSSDSWITTDESDSDVSSDLGVDEDEEADEVREDNIGNGDAEIDTVTPGSSHTSISSDPGVENSAGLFMPSLVDGGKYDYFQVTERPRPFTGHKFVISEFANRARRNQTSLSWVPTRADKLRYILNEYLQIESPMQSVQTQTDSNAEDIVSKCGCRPSKSNITAKAIPESPKLCKIVSWSLDPLHKRVSDDNNNLNSTDAHQDQSISTSLSCPSIVSFEALEPDDGNQAAAAAGLIQGKPAETILSFSHQAPHESEPIPVDVEKRMDLLDSSVTKKRQRALLGVFVCSCCRARKVAVRPIQDTPKS